MILFNLLNEAVRKMNEKNCIFLIKKFVFKI